jgi:predicted double-glycine peptidase
MHALDGNPIWLPWLQAAGVVALGAAGLAAGTRCARLPSRGWLWGYLLPLGAVLLCGAAFRYRPLELVPPFAWLTAGRREYLVLAFCGAMIFGTLLPRLAARRQRIAVLTLVACLILVEAAWPFLAPAFQRRFLIGLVTQFDTDGVCRQSTDFTCGPAAAVTALKQLGIPADEGELAVLFSTTASTGTPPDLLAARLNARYGPAGLRASHRAFRSVAELQDQPPLLAWVKFAWLTDHLVAVLELTPDQIVLGDPFRGRRVLSHAAFEAEWRLIGVTLRREPPSASTRE